jgi:predicted transcriptional regulator
MDVLKFQANPVTNTFTRNDSSMQVTHNKDAFTPDFFRNAAQLFREIHQQAKRGDEKASEAFKKARKDENERVALNFEGMARRGEIQREIYARLLAGTEDTPVLMDWELTRSGEPIPITFDELNRLHPDFVEELYQFCLENSIPKSPEIPMTAASQTISETTAAGSPTPATLPDGNLTMSTTIS